MVQGKCRPFHFAACRAHHRLHRPPDRDYAGYYDIKTLVCLFSVLAVVGALRDMQVFAALSQRMVRTFRTVRSVCTALVIVTMFGSMLLTNDTALLTFLPLSWFVLQATGQEKARRHALYSAKLRRKPLRYDHALRNPQNLYLFSFFNIPIGTFIAIMLPPFLLSTALILLCCLTFPKEALCVPEAVVTLEPRRAAAYGLLFLSGGRHGAAGRAISDGAAYHRGVASDP